MCATCPAGYYCEAGAIEPVVRGAASYRFNCRHRRRSVPRATTAPRRRRVAPTSRAHRATGLTRHSSRSSPTALRSHLVGTLSVRATSRLKASAHQAIIALAKHRRRLRRSGQASEASAAVGRHVLLAPRTTCSAPVPGTATARRSSARALRVTTVSGMRRRPRQRASVRTLVNVRLGTIASVARRRLKTVRRELTRTRRATQERRTAFRASRRSFARTPAPSFQQGDAQPGTTVPRALSPRNRAPRVASAYGVRAAPHLVPLARTSHSSDSRAVCRRQAVTTQRREQQPTTPVPRAITAHPEHVSQQNSPVRMVPSQTSRASTREVSARHAYQDPSATRRASPSRRAFAARATSAASAPL